MVAWRSPCSAAVVAALAYALSNVLQQREAEQLAGESTLKLGLLAKLADRPRWLFGMAADVGGYVFEAIALGIGALVLVEPILATSLLLSLFLGAAINQRTITRTAWVAAGLFAVGVSLFLYLADPSRGAQLATNRSWMIAAPLIAAFVLACVAAARGQQARAGPCISVSAPAPCSAPARCSRRRSCTSSVAAS